MYQAHRFNPRTRDGCEGYLFSNPFGTLVSIHAPVMGANREQLMLQIIEQFQSTHP